MPSGPQVQEPLRLTDQIRALASHLLHAVSVAYQTLKDTVRPAAEREEHLRQRASAMCV